MMSKIRGSVKDLLKPFMFDSRATKLHKLNQGKYNINFRDYNLKLGIVKNGDFDKDACQGPIAIRLINS